MSSGQGSYVDDNARNSDDDDLPTDIEDDEEMDDDDDGVDEDNEQSNDNVVSDDDAKPAKNNKDAVDESSDEDCDMSGKESSDESNDGVSVEDSSKNPSWHQIIDDTFKEKVDCVNVRFKDGTVKRFHPRFKRAQRDELEKIVKNPHKYKAVTWWIWYHNSAKNQSNKKVVNKKSDAMKQLFGKHNGREKSSNDDGKVEGESKYCTYDRIPIIFSFNICSFNIFIE